MSFQILFINNLTRLMRERNLNFSDLSKELGMGYSSVHNWKTGKTTPSAKSFDDLAKLFGVEVQEFFVDDSLMLPDESKNQNLVNMTAFVKDQLGHLNSNKVDRDDMLKFQKVFLNELGKITQRIETLEKNQRKFTSKVYLKDK